MSDTNWNDLPGRVQMGIKKGLEDLEAGRTVPFNDVDFEEESEPDGPTLLAPEKAMLWVLYDHEHPELSINYPKEEQAEEIIRVLRVNGYAVVPQRSLATAYDRGYDDCYDYFCRGNIRPRRNPYKGEE